MSDRRKQVHPKKPAPLCDAIQALLAQAGGELKGSDIGEALTQEIAHPRDARNQRRVIAAMLCQGEKEGRWEKVRRGVYRAKAAGGEQEVPGHE